jgi:hypothetical protein
LNWPTELRGNLLLIFRYSGSDISNMVNDALMSPVRKLDKTRTWVEVMDDGKIKYAPFDETLSRNPN